MFRVRTFLMCIGISMGALYPFESVCAQEEAQSGPSEQIEDSLVEVQGQDFVRDPSTGQFDLLTYKDRRKTWGFEFSVGMSSYKPKMVTRDLATFGETTSYDEPTSSLVEVQFGPKWNLPFGSLSLDLGAGQFFVQSAGTTFQTNLVVTLYHVGVTFGLDRIYREPYLVPYVSGGMYYAQYSEQGADYSDNTIDNSGASPPTPYIAFGLNIQLNWLDRRTAKSAFRELGMQNGFLYVEARSLMDYTDTAEDFSSNGFDFAGGFRVEF